MFKRIYSWFRGFAIRYRTRKFNEKVEKMTKCIDGSWSGAPPAKCNTSRVGKINRTFPNAKTIKERDSLVESVKRQDERNTNKSVNSDY